MAEKYVVFKVEEWEAMWETARQEMAKRSGEHVASADVMRAILELNKVPDAVVIRRQDKFASPAFHMYACGIQLACSLTDKDIEDDEVTHLLTIADYFHEQGELAADEAYKLPD